MFLIMLQTCMSIHISITFNSFHFRSWFQDKRFCTVCLYYRTTSNISRTLVGKEIVDNSDVVGASPVGADPTTSSFST